MPASAAVVLGQVLVVLVADLLLVTAALLLLGTVAGHRWHRRAAYRQLRTRRQEL